MTSQQPLQGFNHTILVEMGMPGRTCVYGNFCKTRFL